MHKRKKIKPEIANKINLQMNVNKIKIILENSEQIILCSVIVEVATKTNKK